MKFNLKFLLNIALLVCFLQAKSQKVLVSEYNRDELRSTSFEIIGRYNNQYQIYKNIRNDNYISLYAADMKLIKNEPLEMIPERVLNTDFIAYPAHSLMFYQYQKKGIIHIMAGKIGPDAKPIGEMQLLDTTDVNFTATNKIYSVIYSEDKQRIMLVKINTRSERRFIFKTLLYDKELNLLGATRIALDIRDRNDYITDFQLDNAGT